MLFNVCKSISCQGLFVGWYAQLNMKCFSVLKLCGCSCSSVASVKSVQVTQCFGQYLSILELDLVALFIIMSHNCRLVWLKVAWILRFLFIVSCVSEFACLSCVYSSVLRMYVADLRVILC
jgi:hypothetical protein